MLLNLLPGIGNLDALVYYLSILIIMTVNIVCEGVMEYRRRRDDKRVNEATCLIVSAFDQVEKFKLTSV